MFANDTFWKCVVAHDRLVIDAVIHTRMTLWPDNTLLRVTNSWFQVCYWCGQGVEVSKTCGNKKDTGYAHLTSYLWLVLTEPSLDLAWVWKKDGEKAMSSQPMLAAPVTRKTLTQLLYFWIQHDQTYFCV